MTKFTKKYMTKRRKEMARKKRARAKVVKVVKITFAVVAMGAFLYGIYSGAKWEKAHPKSARYINQNDLGYVTPKERLEIQERFGELD